MTIAAAYLTSEGVVLGADSTTTVSVPNVGVVQLLNHAQKIFQIGENTSFGLCTYGSGKIGAASHRSIAARLGDQLLALTPAQSPTVSVVASYLVEILDQEAAKPGTAPFEVGYFVGGIDPGRVPRAIRVIYHFNGLDPNGQPMINTTTTAMNVGDSRFEGAPDIFERIFNGYAPGLPIVLLDALSRILAEQGSVPAGFDVAFNRAFTEAKEKVASRGFTDLPLREAIDYIHTCLAVTIKAFKFRFGPPPCGGPIEIAYISADRAFRWARHKSFQSAIDEHKEVR